VTDEADPREGIRQHVATFFPETGGNKILAWTKTPDGATKRSDFCDTAEQAAHVAMTFRGERDVYLGMALSPTDYGAHHRCKVEDVAGLAGLWLDGDVAGPTHSREDGAAESADDVRAAAARFPLRPTFIIDSGTGLQFFWLFREPWLFTSDDERRAAKVLLARFGRTMEHYAKARKFSVKGTFDLARVMRVPFTFNQCKGTCEPRPTSILESNPDARYEPDDFAEFLLSEADDVRDDETPVDVGELHFDPNAAPPAEKFATILESDVLFGYSWNHERTDRPHWSQSEYDQSVASRAAWAGGWSKQEVCDLIIAHRRKYGADLKLGSPCYRLTVGKAFAPVERKDRERAERAERARAAVEQAVRKVEAEQKPSAAFDAAESLADLPDGERADAFARFKQSLKGALNVRELKKAVRGAGKSKRKRVAPAGGLPEIIINGRQFREVSEHAVKVMAEQNDPPAVYVRCGQPSRIRRDEKDAHAIAPHSPESLRSHLSRVADFYFANKEGELLPVPPPGDTVRDILTLDLAHVARERGLAPFPSLDAITETPVLRPDGSILDRPGYDPATRLFYAPARGLVVPPIPANPTAADVRNAVELIDEAIGEFPYEGDADKANALATVLTPYVRQAIDGKSPLAICDAPQAGTGKSLLAEVIGTVVTGTAPAMMGAPHDDAEWRKQITATLLGGPTVVVIDNLAGVLSSPSLARALTAPVWSDRVLGASQQLQLPQLATWICTGNNVTVGGDLARRCYRIRLDAKTARPWRGRTFRHPDLIGWVKANRGRLIGALLTLCRAWYAAGKPAGTSPVVGSFESWCRTVGGILHVAGVPGFLANLDSLYDSADEENAQWELLLRAWLALWKSEPVTVGTVADAIVTDAGKGIREALPDALLAFLDSTPRHLQSDLIRIRDAGKFKIRLGKLLKQRNGRRYGDDGLHLARGDDSHNKVATWAVLAGSAGNRGSVFTQRGCNTHSSHDEHTHTDTSHTRCARVMGGNTPATPGTPRNDDEPEFDPDAEFDREEREALQTEGVL
jgi:hypothetical protein